MGRKPSYICQLLADFYVISSWISQDRYKNLVQRKRFIPVVHDTGGKGMRYHLGKVLQDKTKCIIQRNFASGKHQSVYSFIIVGNVYTERRNRKAISRIIKITSFIKCFLVMRVLLQTVHNIPGIFAGTQNGIGEITQVPASGSNDGKIHADQHHWIWNDRSGKIQKLLNRSVSKTGIHQRLIPLVIKDKNILKFIKNSVNRKVFRDDTHIWLG